DHLAALEQRPGCERAHQPDLAAAIDHADTAPGERGADVHRQLLVTGVRRRRGAAIDGEAAQRQRHRTMSSTIRAAVALAPSRTPGIPPPGRVEAPTR